MRKVDKFYRKGGSMVRVNKKYQITIPKEIREELGIKVGDEVEFIRNERGEFVIRKLERRKNYLRVLEDAVGALRMDKKKLEEIQRAIGESFHA